MRIRTALFAVVILLLAVSAFAADGERGAAFRDHSGKGSAADVYDRTPKKAYFLDGVQMAAGTKLPDVQLNWVITREDYQNNTFHVFTKLDDAKAYMKKRDLVIAADGARTGEPRANWPGSCSWTNGYTRFEKSRWCGDSAWLSMYPPYGSYSQLDSISWNNSISCVYAACDWYWTTLYACRYFSTTYSYPDCQDPDSLYIEGGLIVGDLDDFGFNNRTSSTRFE